VVFCLPPQFSTIKSVKKDQPVVWHRFVFLAFAGVSVLTGLTAALALLGSAVGLYSRDTGTWIAVGIGVAALFGYGLLLAYRERATVPRTLLTVLVNGSFGLVIVALKAFVH